MELLYIFNLFSFVGVIGILFYIIVERTKNKDKEERYERKLDKLDRLEEYVYELEERLQGDRPSVSSEELKAKIIKMYEEGRDLMYIEQALGVPRAKIEMVLKFHKLREKRAKV